MHSVIKRFCFCSNATDYICTMISFLATLKARIRHVTKANCKEYLSRKYLQEASMWCIFSPNKHRDLCYWIRFLDINLPVLTRCPWWPWTLEQNNYFSPRRKIYSRSALASRGDILKHSIPACDKIFPLAQYMPFSAWRIYFFYSDGLQ